MFHSTRLHHDVFMKERENYSIRVGAQVPPNAINLAYFHNHHINSNEHLLIVEAPKQTVDHIKRQQIVEKENLPSPSEDWFERHLLFENELGYVGYLTRDSIHWEAAQERESQFLTHTIEVETDAETIDDLFYYQDDYREGTLLLQAAEFIPTRFQVQTQTKVAYQQEQRKMYQANLPEPTAEWPPYYQDELGRDEIEVDGFKGKLHKTGDPRYFKQTTPTIGQAIVRERVVYQQDQLPQQFMENGIVFKLVNVEERIDWISRFGVVRWSGDFVSERDENGLYGTPLPRTSDYAHENVYLMSQNGVNVYGRGHFSEKYPKLPEYIWDAVQFQPFYTHVSDFELQLPDYDTHLYDRQQENQTWMVDTTYSPTGVVWADEWWTQQVFPPKGYEPIGSPTISVNTDDVPHFNYLNVGPFNNDQGRPAYYAQTTDGTIVGLEKNQLWFRDAIVFYKTQSQTFTGYYIGHEPDGVEHTWHGEQLYVGNLSREQITETQVPLAYRCRATYQGMVRYSMPTYKGTAFYSGVLTKQEGVSAYPLESQQHFEMYTDENGFLTTEAGHQALDGRRFLITNHYKALEPLYYYYRLKYPVVMTSKPSVLQYYQGKNIQLLDAQLKPLASRLKFNIELKPVEDSLNMEGKPLYWVYIYTNFITTSKLDIHCLYNAYDLQSKGTERIKTGYLERLNTQPIFVLNEDYSLEEVEQYPQQFRVKVKAPQTIEDTRRKIPFQYIVATTDGAFETSPIQAHAINSKYGLYNEKHLFSGRRYNVSPSVSHQTLTAYDLVLAYSTDKTVTAEQLKGKHFEVRLNEADELTQLHLPKLSLYTNPNGSEPIWVETTEATGFYNETTQQYDQKVDLEGIYRIQDNQIQRAYQVQCLDVQSLKLLTPRETEPLESWFVRIQYGRFSHIVTLNGVRTKLVYSIPEFEQRFYSETYGCPYIEVVGEVAKVVDEHTIKVLYQPLFVQLDRFNQPKNLNVYRQKMNGEVESYQIESWSYTEGLIKLTQSISENDQLLVDYVFEEESYTYRGYTEENGFYRLDVNPNQYHTYTDMNDPWRTEKPVRDLFNSVIYFFARPMLIQPYDLEGQPLEDHIQFNPNVIYHQFGNDQPKDPEVDLLIGSIYLRHNTSLASTTLVDTRQRGGGILDEMNDRLRMELEPSSEHYFDIGYWDGEAFSENAVIIVRLDRRLLKTFGGRFTEFEIRQIVNKWAAHGVLPIIEFVTSLDEWTLPHEDLTLTTLEWKRMKSYDVLTFPRQSEQYVERYQFFRRKKGDEAFLFVGEMINPITQETHLTYRCAKEGSEDYEYQIKLIFTSTHKVGSHYVLY